MKKYKIKITFFLINLAILLVFFFTGTGADCGGADNSRKDDAFQGTDPADDNGQKLDENINEGAYLTVAPPIPLDSVRYIWKEVVINEEYQNGEKSISYLDNIPDDFIISGAEAYEKFVRRIKPEPSDLFHEGAKGVIATREWVPVFASGEYIETYWKVTILKVYEKNIVKVSYDYNGTSRSVLLAPELAQKISFE